jgi:hypothetical protein
MIDSLWDKRVERNDANRDASDVERASPGENRPNAGNTQFIIRIRVCGEPPVFRDVRVLALDEALET